MSGLDTEGGGALDGLDSLVADAGLLHAHDGLECAVFRFGQVLRRGGLAVGTGQLLDLCRALRFVDITSREQCYWAARCLLLGRHADEPLFGALFATYWGRLRPPPPDGIDPNLRPDLLGAAGAALADDGELRQERALRLMLDVPEAELGEQQDGDEDQDAGAEQRAAYSATEILRRKDFSELSTEELAEVRRLIAELRWHTPTHRQRRTRRASKGPHPDPRRALRENLAHGGVLLTLPRRVARRKPRPLVLICDISGSMERYTALLLRFLHAVRQGRGLVETFVFGTRLTRISRQLRVRDTDRALAEVAGEVTDWGGGTRIGDALATFNRRWGRRVLGHDAIVVIISDGWDRGEPAVLAREMAHLQRLSQRLVWLNPLLGLAGYEPLTRGIMAALPYIDDFLASHNLASLEQLARFLSAVDERRPERGHQPAREMPPGSGRGML